MKRRPSDTNQAVRDRLNPYPAYKDTSLELLGKIPAHWNAKRLKFFANLVAGHSPPSKVVTELRGGLPFLQGNAEFGDINPSPRLECDDATKRARSGDILLSVRAPVGAINIADQSYGIGRGLCAIQTKADLQRRFAYYLLTSESRWLHQTATGSTYDAVTASDVGNLHAILPSIREQRVIATYLDRETARIDTLVAKKERLIGLLQEKRAALISHAVTRGLDPDVPTKDSGVEWLGKIPAHWDVKRLRYLATVNDEALPETTDPGMEIAYVDIGNVDSIQGITDVEVMVFEDAPSRARRVVRKGDVIVSTVRTYLRAIAQIETTDTNLIVSTGFAVLRPRQMDYGYVAYVATAPYFVERVVAHSVGVSYPAINPSELTCLDIILPPLDEQCAIAAFLDHETAKIDALSDKVREAIDRLRELRSSLISAAVTGKIDVRDAV